jgi:hypothetical protein
MTIEVGTQKLGRVGRRGRPHDATSLPIGEVDANIFACPACSRPLGVGTRRCPGCGTGLIAGVRASRVIVFVGVGLFSGMIASAALMAVMSVPGTRPADVAVVPPAPIVVPSQAPVASAVAPADAPGIPSNAVSALRQSTFLNQRVVADAERLTIVLATSRPSGSEIAPILRSLASSASFGARLAPTVGEWDQGDVVSRDLATFYSDIGGIADEGLSASLSDARAYVATAKDMLKILASLEGIDAASRTLAGSADIDLPPLVAPAP